MSRIFLISLFLVGCYRPETQPAAFLPDPDFYPLPQKQPIETQPTPEICEYWQVVIHLPTYDILSPVCFNSSKDAWVWVSNNADKYPWASFSVEWFKGESK